MLLESIAIASLMLFVTAIIHAHRVCAGLRFSGKTPADGTNPQKTIVLRRNATPPPCSSAEAVVAALQREKEGCALAWC
jgi:hypothetical protein